ncbi:MAG: acyltransferase family protein [bacterium]|nr:acyltransferase family protein [bacterium]
MDKRISYIDNLRAFCLILMVFGHTGLTLEVKNLVYSFHMPIFYFLSGMLYHGTGTSICRYFGKKAYRLLIPYCLWSLIFYFSAYVWRTAPSANSLSDAFLYGIGLQGGGGALWFLTSLFWTHVFAVFRHKCRIPDWLMLVVSYVPWWFTMENDLRPWLGINMAGPFFFTIGEMFHSLPSWLNRQTENKKKWVLIGVALSGGYCLGMWLGGFPNHQVFNIAYMSHNIGSLIAAIFACVGLVIIFRYLPKSKTIDIISSYISSHAILIIGLHFVPVLFAKQMGFRSHCSEWEFVGIVMLLEVIWIWPTSLLIGKLLPILNGKWYAKKVTTSVQ